MLTQKEIDELKAIYKRRGKEELPNQEAWEMGHRLLRLLSVLTRVPNGSTKTDQGRPEERARLQDTQIKH